MPVTIRVGDLVRWEGLLAEVADVANLPNMEQVLLMRLDRRNALPISVPVSDLSGAEVWHLAGTYGGLACSDFEDHQLDADADRP